MRRPPGTGPLSSAPPACSGARLSPREREIALLVARGLPTKAIARHLGISMWTVSTYLRRIFARFGVGNRAAMIARLFQDGLL